MARGVILPYQDLRSPGAQPSGHQLARVKASPTDRLQGTGKKTRSRLMITARDLCDLNAAMDA